MLVRLYELSYNRMATHLDESIDSREFFAQESSAKPIIMSDVTCNEHDVASTDVKGFVFWRDGGRGRAEACRVGLQSCNVKHELCLEESSEALHRLVRHLPLNLHVGAIFTFRAASVRLQTRNALCMNI